MPKTPLNKANATFSKISVNQEKSLKKALELYGLNDLQQRLLNGSAIDIPSSTNNRFYGLKATFNYTTNGQTKNFSVRELDKMCEGDYRGLQASGITVYVSAKAVSDARRAAVTFVEEYSAKMT